MILLKNHNVRVQYLVPLGQDFDELGVRQIGSHVFDVRAVYLIMNVTESESGYVVGFDALWELRSQEPPFTEFFEFIERDIYRVGGSYLSDDRLFPIGDGSWALLRMLAQQTLVGEPASAAVHHLFHALLVSRPGGLHRLARLHRKTAEWYAMRVWREAPCARCKRPAVEDGLITYTLDGADGADRELILRMRTCRACKHYEAGRESEIIARLLAPVEGEDHGDRTKP